jgi:hypothetical protein
MSDSVTRMEIAEVVRPVFNGDGAHRSDLLAAAKASSVRPQVLEVLAGLPDRRFSQMRDLWESLHHVPIGH